MMKVERTERLKARAADDAVRSVGKTISIRVQRATRRSSGVVVTGVIQECEFVGLRATASSRIAQWRVRIWDVDHVVERLPR